MYLEPIRPDAFRDLLQFGICDIEATDWINFLVIGYYTKVRDKKTGALLKEVHHNFEDMENFCEWVFSEEQPHENIVAHFGGRYDFLFLLDYFHAHPAYHIDTMIPRGSGILSLSVSTIEVLDRLPKKFPKKRIIGQRKDGSYAVKKRNIIFRDSGALLPFSLATLTRDFGVTHVKQTIDYRKIKKVTPKLLKYLKFDIIGTHEVLEKFFSQDIIRRAGYSWTIASQAMKVYRTFLKNKIPSLSSEVDRFVRDSYAGGRTEVFKPFFFQKTPYDILYAYDVNSLYPYIMSVNDFPTKFKSFTKEYLPEEMGFYDVDVEVPYMKIPPLGTKYNDCGWERFIFPVGKFRGKWSTIELEYAKSVGVKILKVHSGVLFYNGGPIFKEYIDTLYEIRLKSKSGSAENIVVKLLMNSTYGKFGLNLMREQIEFDYGQLDVSVHTEFQATQRIRLMKKQVHLDKSFSNVAIAAWVTSCARIYMHKLYMVAPEKLYYSDTDCLMTTHVFPESEKGLGKLKLEFKSVKGCFLLPKTYSLITTAPQWTGHGLNGQEFKTNVKVTAKGFERKAVFWGPDDLYQNLNGDLRLSARVSERIATFKTAAQKDKFLMKTEKNEREIKSRYDKRRLVKTGAYFDDSEPLVIEHGEIVNIDPRSLYAEKKARQRERIKKQRSSAEKSQEDRHTSP